MDYAFPEKYFKVVQFFDHEFGDIATTTRLDDKQRLVFYALRQQAEHGPCTGAAPSIWWTHERFKHDAWKQLDNMSKFEAMVHFVKLLEDHLGGDVNWVQECEALNNKIHTEEQKEKGGESVTAHHRDNDRHLLGEDAWDEDLRAHVQPTAQNINYLASQVMTLRREVHRLRSSNVNGNPKSNVPVRPMPSPSIIEAGSSPRTAVVPPERTGETQSHFLVPPVRCSPTQMTKAALKSSRSAPPPPRKREMSWAEWFGIN